MAIAGPIGSGIDIDAQQSIYESKRVPISFTSTLRQKLKDNKNFPATERSTKSVDTVDMLINPHTIQFAQPKRFQKLDHRNGSVFFHFTNSKGQNNDILKLTFNGNTGNIDRRAYRGNVKKKERKSGMAMQKKLLLWHDLYQLTREPMVMRNGAPNKFHIYYMSPLFPVPIDFEGFYDTVLSFAETGVTPFSREYNFSFTVTSVTPDLDTVLDNLHTPLNDITLNEKATGLIHLPKSGRSGTNVLIGVTDDKKK